MFLDCIECVWPTGYASVKTGNPVVIERVSLQRLRWNIVDGPLQQHSLDDYLKFEILHVL